MLRICQYKLLKQNSKEKKDNKQSKQIKKPHQDIQGLCDNYTRYIKINKKITTKIGVGRLVEGGLTPYHLLSFTPNRKTMAIIASVNSAPDPNQQEEGRFSCPAISLANGNTTGRPMRNHS